MAIRLLRRLGLGFKWSPGRRGNVVALIAVSALVTFAAEAQVTTGSGPSVTVDSGVLDRLGPPPAAKATPSRTAKPPAKTAIHLIPPKSRTASAAPKPPAQASHQNSAAAKPTVATLTPPAAKPPASSDTPLVPPPKQTVAPTKPAATAAPSPVAPEPPAPAAVAAAAPPPSMRVTPSAPAASAPVQNAAAATAGSGETALKFKPGVTELAGGDQPALNAIAARMLASPELRVELISHAVGPADQAMEARRVSLARAVAVRAYLVDKGVQGVRIIVRALGNQADKGPIADQVDLQVVSQ